MGNTRHRLENIQIGKDIGALHIIFVNRAGGCLYAKTVLGRDNIFKGNTRHRLENDKLSFFDHSRLLYVTTSKYEGDWQSILHAHPFSELFYVVDGKGSACILTLFSLYLMIILIPGSHADPSPEYGSGRSGEHMLNENLVPDRISQVISSVMLTTFSIS